MKKKLLLYIILFLNLNLAFSQWNQVGQSLTGDRPLFGYSVSISGNGTRIATVDKTNDGYINVYELQGTTWQPVGNPIGPLVLSVSSPLDLDYDGDRLVVSNVVVNPNSLATCFLVFSFNGTSWEQLGNDYTCETANPTAMVTYGSDAKISDDGTRIMVAAIDIGNLGFVDPGFIEVLELIGNEWTLMGNSFSIGFNPPGSRTVSMTMSADGSKIGYGEPAAPTFYDGSYSVFGYEFGYASVHEWQGDTWVSMSNNLNDNSGPANFGANRGSAVCFNGLGNRIAVGTVGDDTTMSDTGKVEVYEQNAADGSWSQLGNTLYGEAIDHAIGNDIALNRTGNVLAIAAEGADATGDYSIKVYRLVNDIWTLVDNPIIYGDSTLPWNTTLMEFSETGRLALALPFGETMRKIEVFENPSLSVKDRDVSEVKLYPNPFHNQFVLEFDKESKGTWAILSIQGQQLLQGDFNSKQQQIDTSFLKEKGVYILKLETSSGILIKKIVKA
ncbi:T9SS type A sorting domain-containing protein [Kordia sp.]|uniref:T9SS type A sorting domain-containing protein n=1 Tax=Kordia sp. TaxID=1965332 RepID=UPI003D6B01F7